MVISGILIASFFVYPNNESLLAFKSNSPSPQSAISSSLQPNITSNSLTSNQSNSNLSSSGISLELDKKSYTVGETVGLQGSVNNLIEGKNEVRKDNYDSEGKVISSQNLVRLDGHNFSTNEYTSGKNPGEYVVVVTYGDQNGTITYKLTAPPN